MLLRVNLNSSGPVTALLSLAQLSRSLLTIISINFKSCWWKYQEHIHKLYIKVQRPSISWQRDFINIQSMILDSRNCTAESFSQNLLSQLQEQRIGTLKIVKPKIWMLQQINKLFSRLQGLKWIYSLIIIVESTKFHKLYPTPINRLQNSNS